MGSALAFAFARAGYELSVYDTSLALAESVAAGIGAHISANVAELGARSELAVICVKPGDVEPVARTLGGSGALVVSVAAGVAIEALQDWTGHTRLVRAMPNTPARVGAGITALAQGPGVSAEELSSVERLFSSAGQVVVVAEPLMHVVTAVSGSGPAFAVAYAEAVIAAAVDQGMPEEIAKKLTLSTIEGTIAWVKASPELALGQLRDQVTSKGGTTAAGLAAMAEGGFARALRRAIDAATARSRELSQAFH